MRDWVLIAIMYLAFLVFVIETLGWAHTIERLDRIRVEMEWTPQRGDRP